MSAVELEEWLTAISNVRDLANRLVSASGGKLELSLVDLATEERHHFVFTDVLGFRHQVGFGMKRIGNTFLVRNSAWLKAMQSEPLRTTKLDLAKHYLFDLHDGQFEIIALRAPSYRCMDDG